jgi:hypothetical protein
MVSAAIEAEILAGGKSYPLANVLGEGPNVSILPRQRRAGIVLLSCVVPGIGLGTMIWIIFVVSVILGGQQ